MTIAAQPKLMTTEELLALPDDGRERWLIRGELREADREGDVTRRNYGHSRVEANICGELHIWVKTQPTPRGQVLTGEAGVRLRRNPDTTVGVDVAYISAQAVAEQADEKRLVDGPPVLAVEILSPSDKHEEVTEKVQGYLDAGVRLVWVVDPDFYTITVYRPDAEPQLFSLNQTITGDPDLPGFRVALKDIFTP